MAFGSPLLPPTTNRVGRQPEMADREKELVEEVRRLRRERNRVRDEHDREARKRQRMQAQNKLADQAGEPRPFAPDDVAAQTRLVKTLSQRAEAVDAELEWAERKLERFRAHLTPKQAGQEDS